MEPSLDSSGTQPISPVPVSPEIPPPPISSPELDPAAIPLPLSTASSAQIIADETTAVPEPEVNPRPGSCNVEAEKIYSLPEAEEALTYLESRYTLGINFRIGITYILQKGRHCPRTGTVSRRSILDIRLPPFAYLRERETVTEWKSPRSRERKISVTYCFDTRLYFDLVVPSAQEILPYVYASYKVDQDQLTQPYLKQVQNWENSFEVGLGRGSILQNLTSALEMVPNLSLSGQKSGREETDLSPGSRAPTGHGSHHPGEYCEPVGDEGIIPAISQELRDERRSMLPYLVVGILSQVGGVPYERLIRIEKSSGLSRLIWRAVLRLRGTEAIFSLKDVQGFKVYKCPHHNLDASLSTHKRVKLNTRSEQILQDFFHAYQSWYLPEEIEEKWFNWISALNDYNPDPGEGDMLSLEIVLGWSAPRITVAIVTPVVLSLGIGLWLNSKDWGDATTIQTAWSVASYIATAGAFLAALLAILSSIDSK
ncbi:hypothetical protein VTL71DRAFT_7897 [Oculimacula yallundae]|uniref:Uncharacterized protein n=1 Tax=Oculimacula yallundae TaxID=86028 RepID=A0ABR4CYI3_9HELO